MGQKLGGDARILAADGIRDLEGGGGAGAQVVQVADRGPDDEQAPFLRLHSTHG